MILLVGSFFGDDAAPGVAEPCACCCIARGVSVFSNIIRCARSGAFMSLNDALFRFATGTGSDGEARCCACCCGGGFFTGTRIGRSCA